MEGLRDGDRLFAGGPEGDDGRKRMGLRSDRQKRKHKERKKNQITLKGNKQSTLSIEIRRPNTATDAWRENDDANTHF